MQGFFNLQKLIPFHKNETSDIFEQMDQKINFNTLNIEHQHECFSDYNYLGELLEINDPQLQFLVLAVGCVIQHNHQFDQVESGFIQLQQNQSEYKNGYYINHVEDGIVLIAFRTFYHSSFLFHQCKFDGFSNQCIKGNNDHYPKLGISRSSRQSDYQELLWESLKSAYHPCWFFFFYYFCKKISLLGENQQRRMNLLVAAAIFFVVSNWQFIMIISIWKFVQMANKFNYLEKFILYGTFMQIYLNMIIGSEHFFCSKETAESLIFLYIIMLVLQVGSIIFSKASLVILLYLVNYYVNYLKAMIELNTLVDNDFKFGMIYLNVIIGNLQELDARTLITFKHQVLQILLENQITLFPYIMYLFLLFITLYSGHKQVKGRRFSIKYVVECFCQMQISLLYLPLAVLSTIVNIREYQVSCENFYLFWIFFFYFPKDFPFIQLFLSFGFLFFDNGRTFTFIYKETMKMTKSLKQIF